MFNIPGDSQSEDTIAKKLQLARLAKWFCDNTSICKMFACWLTIQQPKPSSKSNCCWWTLDTIALPIQCTKSNSCKRWASQTLQHHVHTHVLKLAWNKHIVLAETFLCQCTSTSQTGYMSKKQIKTHTCWLQVSVMTCSPNLLSTWCVSRTSQWLLQMTPMSCSVLQSVHTLCGIWVRLLHDAYWKSVSDLCRTPQILPCRC